MEELTPIEGYEGLYSATQSGRIYSHTEQRFIPDGNPESVWGYRYVRLRKNGEYKQFSVHRLIAKTFIPNPNNLPIVNHIDGNKANNSVDNLEWCTQKENVAHALKNDLRRKKAEQRKIKWIP